MSARLVRVPGLYFALRRWCDRHFGSPVRQADGSRHALSIVPRPSPEPGRDVGSRLWFFSLAPGSLAGSARDSRTGKSRTPRSNLESDTRSNEPCPPREPGPASAVPLTTVAAVKTKPHSIVRIAQVPFDEVELPRKQLPDQRKRSHFSAFRAPRSGGVSAVAALRQRAIRHGHRASSGRPALPRALDRSSLLRLRSPARESTHTEADDVAGGDLAPRFLPW